MTQTKTLEQSLEELNEIVEQMGKPELTLEDSFRLYQQGLQLCKSCHDKIDKIEKKMELIHDQEESEGN